MPENVTKDKEEKSVIDYLDSLNKAGAMDANADFKKRYSDGVVGRELTASVLFKVKEIVMNNAPPSHKITQEQAAHYFFEIRGLFNVIA